MNNIINNYNIKQTNIINDKKNDNFINNSIKKIYIINLNTDRLRENYIKILMKKLNINYTLVTVKKPSLKIYNNVIKLSKPLSKKMTFGEVGCYLSHLWCLQDIIKNNYTDAIIFEDDIIVHKDFLSLLKKYITKNNETENEIPYDFLMLGAADHGFNKGNKELIKDNIYIPKHHVIMGTHAIYYSLHGAKTIFDYRLKYPVYFDKNLKELFTFFKKDRTGVCYPNLFTVENSTTNMNHQFGISKYKYNDYYYNECYDNFNFLDYHFIYLDLFPKYMLESAIQILSSSELIRVLLMNYFNNDEELTKFHYKKLDIDYFSLEEYKELLEIAKDPFTQLYYTGGVRVSPPKGITSGRLLLDKISRESTLVGKVSPLFSKYSLDFSLQNEKISYKIENEFPLTKKYVAHLHCFNINDFFKIYGKYIKRIEKYMDIIVTRGAPPNPRASNCEVGCRPHTILEVENCGFDIGSKFVVIDYLKTLEKTGKIANMPTYILFLHSKTCEYTRNIYFNSLINNLEYMIENIEKRERTNTENPDIGGFFPPTIHKGDDIPIIYNQKYLAKEVLHKCLYAEPTFNKLYLEELIEYFELPKNNITLFPSGNCYFLHIDMALRLFSDLKLYNILNYKENENPVKCFDYNWVKTYYNISYDEIEFIYEAYIKFGLNGNSLQVEERKNNMRFADGMIEDVFERIVFQMITSLGKEIVILDNGKNHMQIRDLSEKINKLFKNKLLKKV